MSYWQYMVAISILNNFNNNNPIMWETYVIIKHLVRMDNMTNKNSSTAYCDLNYASFEK